MDLDFLPSPIEDRPGLMIRDPLQYSDTTLIVPPALVPVLSMFDGEQTVDEACRALLEITGDIRAGEIQKHLQDALENAGFVEGERFEQIREEREQAFASSDSRPAAHAGGAYPDNAEELKGWLAQNRFAAGSATSDGLVGIAAPHVSPEGGWDSYRAAYGALGPDLAEKVFVVLGTSHYGEPEKFGLTRKPFVTPFGSARTQTDLVESLAGPATRMEDYCHAVEHSIEFQVMFLQSLYGPDVKILPVLCGPFAHSLYLGGQPEEDEGVRRFFDALAELHAREGKRLCWLLGVDMAHMGRRYGDPAACQANAGEMLAVAQRDKERIGRLAEGDGRGFWERVQDNHDDLKWCGSAPLYTFLKAIGDARGELRHYEQWNIDDESVVSFGAIAFRNA